MNIIKHVIRGCGTLPNYGEHPGTVPLIGLIFLGVIAGAKGGWMGCVMGAGVMLAIFGSIYLVGAYTRSVEDPPAKHIET